MRIGRRAALMAAEGNCKAGMTYGDGKAGRGGNGGTDGADRPSRNERLRSMQGMNKVRQPTPYLLNSSRDFVR